MIDVLHCIDQGVCAHLIGNVIWECVALHIWGTNIDANVVGVERELDAFF